MDASRERSGCLAHRYEIAPAAGRPRGRIPRSLARVRPRQPVTSASSSVNDATVSPVVTPSWATKPV
jgi:hypothetical protein